MGDRSVPVAFTLMLAWVLCLLAPACAKRTVSGNIMNFKGHAAPAWVEPKELVLSGSAYLAEAPDAPSKTDQEWKIRFTAPGEPEKTFVSLESQLKRSGFKVTVDPQDPEFHGMFGHMIGNNNRGELLSVEYVDCSKVSKQQKDFTSPGLPDLYYTISILKED